MQKNLLLYQNCTFPTFVLPSFPNLRLPARWRVKNRCPWPTRLAEALIHQWIDKNNDENKFGWNGAVGHWLAQCAINLATCVWFLAMPNSSGQCYLNRARALTITILHNGQRAPWLTNSSILTNPCCIQTPQSRSTHVSVCFFPRTAGMNWPWNSFPEYLYPDSYNHFWNTLIVLFVTRSLAFLTFGPVLRHW